MKKLAAILAAVALVIPMTACRRDEIAINKEKTQLYVFAYNGAYGQAWLDAAAARFEEEYKDYELNGKKGVQIVVTSEKDQNWRGDVLGTRLPTLQEEIFFTEATYVRDFKAAGHVLDITDAVTEPLSEYGETESIEDKMTAEQIAYWKQSDGHYYALPFYEAYMSMTYDADLFNEKSLYFKEGGGWTNAAGQRTVGPDGTANTDDDGLPVTYDDFFALLDQMIDVGISQPVAWPGMAPQYLYDIAGSMGMSYEGLENAMVQYQLDSGGRAIPLVKPETIQKDGTALSTFETEDVVITRDNIDQLSRQAGLLYALDFLYRLLKKPSYYSNLSFSGTYTQVDTENAFITSKYSTEKVGILLDGSYWESEGRSIFDTLADKPGSARTERNFRIMPYLVPDEAHRGAAKPSFTSFYDSISFISSYIDPSKADLAKEFLRFVHTDVSMSEWTVFTSTPKPFTYELQPSDENKVSPYGKSVLAAKNRSNVIYPYSTDTLFLAYNNADFQPSFLLWATIGSDTGLEPVNQFGLKSTTVKEFYEGMLKFRSDKMSKWSEVQ